MKNELMYCKVKKAAMLNPQKTALVFGDKEISYQEMMDNIHKTANAMKIHGITCESTVTITLPNTPQAVYTLYAANMLGASISIIHPLLPPNAIFEIMQQTKSNYLFLMDTAYEAFSGINAQLSAKVNIFPCTLSCDTIFEGESIEAFEPSQSFGSILMHSGGTTDKSKTVILSNEVFNILASAAPEIYSEEGDISWLRMIMLLPIFHGFGLCICLHTALIFSGTLILVSRFTPAETLQTINNKRASIIIGVPAIFDKMGEVLAFDEKTKDYDLSCIRKIYCGGDTLPVNVRERFDREIAARGAKTQIYVGYGLTECVAVCTVNNDKNHLTGSIGKPLSNIRIKFIGEDGADSGDEGEICVASNTLMQGYYGDSVTTDKQFILDSDGTKWLRTGDYGYRNKDGFIFFKQRIKRMIKFGNGLNIFPAEIEECALSSGLVAAAAATQTQNDVLTLFIIPKGAAEDALISELEAHLRANLPYWCVPRRFVLKEALPLTPYNKVNYILLSQA